MAVYTVRVTWESTADITVKAENTIEAETKATQKAKRAKPDSTKISSVRVTNVEH